MVNSGTIVTIDTNTGAGVAFHSGGTVSNAAGGTITGYNNAVFASGGVATVSNYGTLASTGTASGAVDLTVGGVTNGASGLTGGLINGKNLGISVLGSAGTIAGFGTIQALGSVVNGGGTITGGSAIFLNNGGRVTNGASGSTAGLIESYHFTVQSNVSAATTVVNFGTIVVCRPRSTPARATAFS